MVQNYVLVKSDEQFDKMVAALERHAGEGGLIGFDVETGYVGPDREKGALDPSWSNQFVVGFSVSVGDKFSAYVPLHHDLGGNLDPVRVWTAMKPVLETGPIVAHHAKFEQRNLLALEEKGHGPEIRLNVVADSMLEAYVLSEWRGVGLKDLVLAEFGHEMAKIETLFSGYTAKQMKSLRFNLLELTPAVVEYACEDAYWTLKLHNRLGPRAEAERGRINALEHAISGLMAEVERRGVAVDREALAAAQAEAEAFCTRMELNVLAAFSEWAGRDMSGLSLNSPKQLQEFLYRDLGVKVTRLTAGAQKNPESFKEKPEWSKFSTDDVALETVAREYPAVRLLLELRQAKNLKKRLDSWLWEFLAYYPDSRIHAQYNQVIVGTGRFAANFPPIQQVPKAWRFASAPGVDVWKDKEAWSRLIEEGRSGRDYWTGNFRDFIVPAPGCYFLTFDYSQIELRIMAGVSQEPALLEAFEKEVDVHTLTAAMMLGKPVEEVDYNLERPIGKTTNFGLLYQMGAKSLADRLGVSLQKGRELYAAYFASFTSVTSWMERVKEEGRRKGFIETPFGRKWTIWELQSSNRAIYAKGERMLVNAPIQGGAADYMKFAMVRAKKALAAAGLWGRVMIVMNQHDALTFEAAEDVDPQMLRSLLEPAVAFKVKGFPKIRPDWEIGYTWGSSQPWSAGLVPEFSEGRWRLVAEDGGDSAPAQPQRPSQAPAPVPEPAPAPDSGGMSARDFRDAGEALEVVDPDLPKGVPLVVQVAEMPTHEQFKALMALLSANVGPNSLTLATPEGDVCWEQGTSLCLEDRGRIATILPGSVLVLAEVDPSVLFEGISL